MEKQKKVSKSKQVRARGSASAGAIATALEMTFPKQTAEILKVMSGAATSGSMKRKLDRVQKALDGLTKGGV
jgi:hypothetical protein